MTRLEIAVHLAPAFRDKLDFSDPKDWDKLAEFAYKAADALISKEMGVAVFSVPVAKEAAK